MHRTWTEKEFFEVDNFEVSPVLMHLAYGSMLSSGPISRSPDIHHTYIKKISRGFDRL